MASSPYINRFLQPDTIIPDLSNPQSWNRYSYVTNRPVNFSDPTGHMQISDGNSKKGSNCHGEFAKYCNNGKPKSKAELLAMRNQKSKLPIYGDGLIGPPEPAYETFHTSFQMFPEIPGSDVNGYTDFSTGGNPEHTPAIYNTPVNDRPTIVNQGLGWAELSLDILKNILPIYYQNSLPYDQDVYINYGITFNNIPSRNATSTVALNNLSIVNTSTIVDSVINYSISITSVDRSQVVTRGSAAPGETAMIPIPSGLNIYNGLGGFNITIIATTKCVGSCITTQNPPVFNGVTRFNFNP